MSKLKDKLSNNMRMAKENQPQAPAKAAPGQAQAPQPKPAVVNKPAPAQNPQPAEPKHVPGDVPDTGNKLFPDRVWPD